MSAPHPAALIGLPAIYALAGLMFAGFAAFVLRTQGARRWRPAGFLALVAVSFLFGDRLGDLGEGVLVLALVALAAIPARRGSGAAAPPTPAAPVPPAPAGRLLWLALVVPAVALMGALTLKGLHLGARPLVDPEQATVASLALGVLVALGVAVPLLRATPLEPVAGGAGLAGAIGWALILPQMLAALGAVFTQAGVGHAVADLTDRLLPHDSALAAVVAYTVGMALFTMVMGNAFAAFPVMTAGIGLPLIVRRLHGDPAVTGAIGMLSGFCGTLLTPMAANFNVVPVALLNLPDRWAVIRAQAPTALILLAVNTALLYLLAFKV